MREHKKDQGDHSQPDAIEQPERSGDGVDVTLIRWMLSLSPAERLRVLQNNVRSILKLRHDISGPDFFEVIKVLHANDVELNQPL